MTTTTITETKPVLDDAPPCWPPVSHIIRKEDEPVKPGTIALCGEKLMGLDLGWGRASCKKCEAERRRMLGI